MLFLCECAGSRLIQPDMLARLVLCFAALLVALVPLPSSADTQDIAATSRSVVRVALVTTDGDNAYFVGHGSGIVVAPGKVLTNAHVVEMTRTEPNIVIGVIPAEGTRSFSGKVIAFSPGNDLALIQIDGGENLPVATFFAGATTDGQSVTAIGYPGAVDRAQGMELNDIIKPMSAVRTGGTISAGRSAKQYDTVLHTAPLASGNSGGPLVDACGRVLGVNSFGSLSDGNDAEYGFAVSDREVANFLRQAGVQFQRSAEPCRSLADLEEAEALADARAKADAAQRAQQEAIRTREIALNARETAQQEIIARRENMMALAAVLLAGAVLAGGGAVLSSSHRQRKRVKWLGISAGVLGAAAILAFLLRPSFEGVDTPAGSKDESEKGVSINIPPAQNGTGALLCSIDRARSRITVSETNDVPLDWRETGCVNGKTQMVQDGTRWSRAFVLNNEPTISIRSFDPATGSYRSDRYSVDAATADQARELRGKIGWEGCTSDPGRIEALGQMQAQVRALLTNPPNERLVYRCEPAAPQP